MSSRSSRNSRISRMSSQGQIGPFNRALPPRNDVAAPVRAPTNPAKNAVSYHGRSKRQQETVRSRRDIFEISQVEESKTTTKKIDESFGRFLQDCALCRKKLIVKDDFYMYGFLGAFCSPRCREDMILIDGFDKQFPSEACMKLIQIPRSKIIMAPRRDLSDDSDLSD